MEWFRINDLLMPAARGVFEVEMRAPEPLEVVRIERAAALLGDRSEQYLVSKTFFARNSFRANWAREGEKERMEVLAPVDLAVKESEGRSPSSVSTMAFDGNIVRSLEYGGVDGREQWGNIDSVAHFSLDKSTHPYPMAFIHEFGMTPYSRILAEGKEFSMRPVTKNGRPYAEVRVKHPSEETVSLVLYFDEAGRLAEREIHMFWGEKIGWHFMGRQELLDYRSVPSPGGNSLDFPWKMVWHYYIGPLVDGRPVEWATQTVTIKELSIVEDVPDEEFLLRFPKDTQMRDGLTGMGLIRPGLPIETVLGDIKLAAADPTTPSLAVHAKENKESGLATTSTVPAKTPEPPDTRGPDAARADRREEVRPGVSRRFLALCIAGAGLCLLLAAVAASLRRRAR